MPVPAFCNRVVAGRSRSIVVCDRVAAWHVPDIGVYRCGWCRTADIPPGFNLVRLAHVPLERKHVRVDGHVLVDGGDPYDDAGDPALAGTTIGRGKCACGVLGPVYDTRTGRRQWHRDIHKPRMLLALR